MHLLILSNIHLFVDSYQAQLTSFLSFVHGVEEHIIYYRSQGYIMRAYKKNTDDATFAEFNRTLDELLMSLQLTLAVDERQRLIKESQDILDAEEDHEQLLDLITSLLSEQNQSKEKLQEVLSAMDENRQVQLEMIKEMRERESAAAAGKDFFEDMKKKIDRVLNSSHGGEVMRPHKVIKETSLRIGRRIGKGGFGDVFEAKAYPHESSVAYKQLNGEHLRGNKTVQSELLREAVLLEAADSSCVIRFFGMAVTDTDVPCGLVMELAVCSLHQVLYDKDYNDYLGELTLSLRVAVITEVCRTMEYLTNIGIVHRDIKPGNILVADNGTLKLSDFGISKQKTAALSTTGGAKGTPAYMAPELFLQDSPVYGQVTDMYAFAVLMNEVLTGEAPFASLAGDFHNLMRNSKGALRPALYDPQSQYASWRRAGTLRSSEDHRSGLSAHDCSGFCMLSGEIQGERLRRYFP